MWREGREQEKNKEEKSERERGRNICEICVQVIPPTLLACNPNVVSGVKSCQSSNGQPTVLCTEFSSLIFVFCKRINPLRPKIKELASITCSSFSAVDFHSTDHIPALSVFCRYYGNAV